ncbi:MAG: type II toxin-antitoxin system prevent-host-death family antitoxin [Hyphomicrobiaceae bacterium]|nr:MAG: type II toxin-antitoxin system prevent-host-death family antitoxin [Hyphomicrobiaceae bacterium]
MRTVGIKTLKNELSRYIRAAEAGERILVTDRGRVVAEITPPTPTASAEPRTQEEIRADLIRRGVLKPAIRKLGEALPARHPTITLEELLRDLDEDRADRWPSKE